MTMRITGYCKLTALTLLICWAAAADCRAAAGAGYSASSDSLVVPGDIYVIEQEYLSRLNIDTFDDILQIVPWVSSWREGVPGSRTGFSAGGAETALLVNGRLIDNIYTSEPLERFVDLGRLVRVEVIRRGVFSLTGEIGSGAAINLVVEREGRESPFTQADFTYGGSNRRARRIWFSTPRSYVTAAISYNEYLQDAIEALDFGQNRLIGDDHMKAVSFDLSMGPDQGALVHLTRFEDSFERTACSRSEDIRTSGFDSWIDYSGGGFRGSIRHRGIERLRLTGRMTGLCSGLNLELDRSLGNLHLRTFLTGRNYLFENRFSGVETDPEIHNYFGGATLFSRFAGNLPLRGSLFLGDHSVSGHYIGWEASAAREGKDGSYLSFAVSRKPELPSAAQFFHPVSFLNVPECFDIRSAGSESLDPQMVEEVSAESSFGFGLMINLFYRKIQDLIEPEGPGGSFRNAPGSEEVSGVSARFGEDLSWRRFTLELEGGGEYFFETGGLRAGVPEYTATGNLYLRFPIFKKTETITLHLNSMAFGARQWHGESADPGSVHNFSLSMTLMSAVIRFQYKNILDTEYQTVPGFNMAERHFRIGILWNLSD